MVEIVLAASGGGDVRVDETALSDLRAQLRGPARLPGEPGYDEARTLYNAMIDRRPALILRCAGVADVMVGVRFAAANSLLVSVPGGTNELGRGPGRRRTTGRSRAC